MQRKKISLNRESNPQPLAFHASVQIIKSFGFKYQGRLKSLLLSCDNPKLTDSADFTAISIKKGEILNLLYIRISNLISKPITIKVMIDIYF